MRTKISLTRGAWIERTLKHRYCFLIDKSLKVNYEEKPFPKVTDIFHINCCDGKGYVFDKRFNEYWTCPYCTGVFKQIKDINTFDLNEFKKEEKKVDKEDW